MSYSKITIKVPEVNKVYGPYSRPEVKRANIQVIKKIDSKYGSVIDRWATIFEFPKGVLISFIATESGGNQNLSNFCCYGLMQVSPAGIYECVTKWKNIVGSDMPQPAKSELLYKVPDFYKKYNSTLEKKIVKELKADANFNILCGTIMLRWLIERFSTVLTGGQMNKAIIGYNAGAYTTSINTRVGGVPVANKIPIDTAKLVVNPKVPKETQNYLVKMLGVDGFMSLVYKDKAL